MSEIIGNGIFVGGKKSEKSRLYIMPPIEEGRALYLASSGTYSSREYRVPSHTISAYASPYDSVSTNTEIIDGITTPYMYRNGGNTATWCFSKKVKAGEYSKLYAHVRVTQMGSTQWRWARIHLYSGLSFSQSAPANGNTMIKEWRLSDVGWTVENLMSQDGISMNINSNVEVSRQVIELDVSDIDTDFYVGFYNCDLNVSVYELYLE